MGYNYLHNTTHKYHSTKSTCIHDKADFSDVNTTPWGRKSSFTKEVRGRLVPVYLEVIFIPRSQAAVEKMNHSTEFSSSSVKKWWVFRSIYFCLQIVTGVSIIHNYSVSRQVLDLFSIGCKLTSLLPVRTPIRWLCFASASAKKKTILR